MAVISNTGSGTPVTRLVSTGTSISLPVNTSTSLFQSASETITASGFTLAFIGRTIADINDFVQVTLTVDGVEIYNDIAGQQVIVKEALTAGSHTVAFTAYALNQDCNMLTAGLMVIDLGL